MWLNTKDLYIIDTFWDRDVEKEVRKWIDRGKKNDINILKTEDEVDLMVRAIRAGLREKKQQENK